MTNSIDYLQKQYQIDLAFYSAAQELTQLYTEIGTFRPSDTTSVETLLRIQTMYGKLQATSKYLLSNCTLENNTLSDPTLEHRFLLQQKEVDKAGEFINNLVQNAIKHQASNKHFIEFHRHDIWKNPTVSVFSNSYFCEIDFGGQVYTSSEAAFQAQKFSDQPNVLAKFSNASSAHAINLGDLIKMTLKQKAEWEEVGNTRGNKVAVMMSILKAKFDQNPDLQKFLLATGDAYLVMRSPSNHPSHLFWSGANADASVEGKNFLGFCLMRLRKIYGGSGVVQEPKEYLNQLTNEKEQLASEKEQLANETEQRKYFLPSTLSEEERQKYFLPENILPLPEVPSPYVSPNSDYPVKVTPRDYDYIKRFNPLISIEKIEPEAVKQPEKEVEPEAVKQVEKEILPFDENHPLYLAWSPLERARRLAATTAAELIEKEEQEAKSKSSSSAKKTSKKEFAKRGKKQKGKAIKGASVISPLNTKKATSTTTTTSATMTTTVATVAPSAGASVTQRLAALKGKLTELFQQKPSAHLRQLIWHLDHLMVTQKVIAKPSLSTAEDLCLLVTVINFAHKTLEQAYCYSLRGQQTSFTTHNLKNYHEQWDPSFKAYPSVVTQLFQANKWARYFYTEHKNSSNSSDGNLPPVLDQLFNVAEGNFYSSEQLKKNMKAIIESTEQQVRVILQSEGISFEQTISPISQEKMTLGKNIREKSFNEIQEKLGNFLSNLNSDHPLFINVKQALAALKILEASIQRINKATTMDEVSTWAVFSLMQLQESIETIFHCVEHYKKGQTSIEHELRILAELIGVEMGSFLADATYQLSYKVRYPVTVKNSGLSAQIIDDLEAFKQFPELDKNFKLSTFPKMLWTQPNYEASLNGIAENIQQLLVEAEKLLRTKTLPVLQKAYEDSLLPADD